MNRRHRTNRHATTRLPDVSAPGDDAKATARPASRHVVARTAFGLLVFGLLVVFVFWRTNFCANEPEAEPDFEVPALTARDEPRIRDICSHCHLLPSPDVLPRSAWQETIWEMFELSGYGRTVKWPIAPEALVVWYEQQAPEEFAFAVPRTGNAKSPRSPFAEFPIHVQAATPTPVVSNIQVADVRGDGRPEVIVCDMLHGDILLGNVDGSHSSFSSIAKATNPAHVEVSDLDADGHADLVVANLGSFTALDHNLGSVLWLRQRSDRTFEQFTLADELGRVADVQPTDIDADGDLDVLVAEFGWRVTGHLLLLENQTPKGAAPRFAKHEIDGLSGASHVDVVDLDGDGVGEIVVLYSQGHEMVKCYARQSDGVFTIRELYRAPSPAWGFSGSQIVDLDGDGDLDILLSNGDTFDNSILKPYHGVQWLENRGSLEFRPHQVATLYGAYRAAAADLDGDGDQDIAACALITPTSRETQQIGSNFDSLVWFEQTTPQSFVRHRLEAGEYHHPTLVLSDYDLDGDVDLLVGNGQLDASLTSTDRGCFDLWINETK